MGSVFFCCYRTLTDNVPDVDSSFSHAAMSGHVADFQRIATEIANNWSDRIAVSEKGEIEVNLLNEMLSVAIQSIGSTTLGEAFKE